MVISSLLGIQGKGSMYGELKRIGRDSPLKGFQMVVT